MDLDETMVMLFMGIVMVLIGVLVGAVLAQVML